MTFRDPYLILGAWWLGDVSPPLELYVYSGAADFCYTKMFCEPLFGNIASLELGGSGLLL